jgi:hypothetical protein
MWADGQLTVDWSHKSPENVTNKGSMTPGRKMSRKQDAADRELHGPTDSLLHKNLSDHGP